MNSSKTKDPRDFGYYMPGEWYDHAACWMAWPARVQLWPDIEATKKAYADVVNTIAEFEPLKLLVLPSMLEDAKTYLSEKVDLKSLINRTNNFIRFGIYSCSSRSSCSCFS